MLLSITLHNVPEAVFDGVATRVLITGVFHGRYEGAVDVSVDIDRTKPSRGGPTMTVDDQTGHSVLRRLAEGSGRPALEVMGPSVEFLTITDEPGNRICVMRAVIPPGVTVPLHRHDDFEDFFILAGEHQVLVESDGRREWVDVRAGDYVQVPGDVLHAHRNLSAEPAVDLIITTARIGRFFEEVGRPVGAPPRTRADIDAFVATCVRYGYQLATPEENAAVGISLPAFNA
ncbi:cupin domain-containing protein [Mycolicibacterium iranicum]|nr:cupin domain-containing protein [Mycolicibacterium iranicum]